MSEKLTEDQIQKLMEDVRAMRKAHEANGSPEARKAFVDEIYKEVYAKLHPPKRKMAWAGFSKEEEDGVKKVFLTDFLRASLHNDHAFMENAGLKTVMSEGTPAQGGYTVPVEYSDEIIKLESEESIIRRLARVFPMASLTRPLPRQLTNVTVTWTEEDVAKTETKPTFDRFTQTAKKVAAIVRLTDELREDSSINLDKFVMELIADAMALEFDRIAFNGNTGAGDPFMGVYYAAGVNVNTMVGASVTFDDVKALINSVASGYRKGGTLVTSTVGEQALQLVKDSTGRYIWSSPNGVAPAKIWGYPYEVSDQIVSNLGVGLNETPLLFGNWKKYFYISDRGGYEVVSSNQASAWIAAALVSAFTQDETWHRFKRRVSLDVALPVAFSRMLIK